MFKATVCFTHHPTNNRPAPGDAGSLDYLIQVQFEIVGIMVGFAPGIVFELGTEVAQ